MRIIIEDCGEGTKVEISKCLEGHFTLPTSPSPDCCLKDNIPPVPIPWDQLRIRSQKVCRALGVDTVSQLADKTRSEILAVANCGPATYDELAEVMLENGFVPKD